MSLCFMHAFKHLHVRKYVRHVWCTFYNKICVGVDDEIETEKKSCTVKRQCDTQWRSQDFSTGGGGGGQSEGAKRPCRERVSVARFFLAKICVSKLHFLHIKCQY